MTGYKDARMAGLDETLYFLEQGQTDVFDLRGLEV